MVAVDGVDDEQTDMEVDVDVDGEELELGVADYDLTFVPCDTKTLPC